jgi:type I restriction enzyme R subunit
MHDHGLFQAICRVNRLDGEDKDYGYIVDYQDLFNSLEDAITDYTSGALDGYEKKDIDGLLSGRIEKAREDLEEGLEQIRALVEPIAPPKGTLQYQQYFCAKEQGNAEQLKANEPKRVELYKAVAAVSRAYSNLANEMSEAGYTDAEAAAIKAEIGHYIDVRAEVKLGAGEDLDFKQYEAGMRYLLDTYIQADASEVVSDFEDIGLVHLIVRLGAGAIDKLPKGIKKDPEAVAETITNNMRKVIIDEHALNPKYYDKMSELLDAIIEQRRQQAIDYQEYLAKLLEAAKKLGTGEGTGHNYPDWVTDGARKALVDMMWPNVDVARSLDHIIRITKPDAWVGNSLKEKVVLRALKKVAPAEFNDQQIQELFSLVKARDEYR